MRRMTSLAIAIGLLMSFSDGANASLWNAVGSTATVAEEDLGQFQKTFSRIEVRDDVSVARVTAMFPVPLAAIETTEVGIAAFSSCDEAFARDEGEGDLSLAWWRDAHWRFFSRRCAAMRCEPAEDMPVVFERFRLIAAAKSSG